MVIARSTAASRLTVRERDLCSGLVAAPAVCVMVAGSYARGWEHKHSDIDVSVVVASLPDAADVVRSESGVGHRVRYQDGKRWEIEYYPVDYMHSLAAGIAAAGAAIRRGLDAASVLGPYDLGRALRVSDGVAVGGSEAARRLRGYLHAAGLVRTVTELAVDSAEASLDDALGLLMAGDITSAVLAAGSAVGYTVDAYLAANGQLTPGAKWRVRKCEALAATRPETAPVMDPDTCRRWLTMADLDEASPGTWVEGAVDLCQRLLYDVREQECR